jgi:tripartite-type tricarboxylate transporter receptor subunit TctC
MHYRRLGVLIFAVVGLQGSAAAQSWPSKPIRAIVPFTAGSASDIVRAGREADQDARHYGELMPVRLKGSVRSIR